MNSHISSETNELFRWSALSALANRQRLRETVSTLRQLNSDPVLIKGWANGRFYPDERPRGYTDIDLAVDPTTYAEFLLQVDSLAITGVSIDAHSGLCHLDNTPWEILFERSYTVDLDKVPIRVLADEDNLRVTATHWLWDGGVYKEKLWDIYYLVLNCKADFDWELCLNSSGPIRRTWVMAAVATARDHLDLDVSGLPPEVANFRLPKWYKKTLEREWKRGPYFRIYLYALIRRPRKFLEQLYRRFPPNPIAATIDVEGPIDDGPRLKYQIKSLINKAGPFARGVFGRLKR